MPHCVQCGIENATVAICPHHMSAVGDDWAVSNRIWCAFFHRGIVPARLSPAEREDDYWTQAFVNDAA